MGGITGSALTACDSGSWAAWQILPGEGETPAVAAGLGIKFPTGDSDHLFGSGATDVALWTAASREFGSGRARYGGYGRMGLLYAGAGKVLPEIQRHWVGFATATGSWQPFSRLLFKVQLDGHTPFYRHTSFRALDGYSLQLTLGGTIQATGRIAIDIGVAEDLVGEVAPDVTYYLALRHLF